MAEQFAVDRPGRPALTVEVAGRGLLALRQSGEVVLMARADSDWYGVAYAVTGRFRSPVPPIRAARSAVSPSWAHHFAAALIASADGPLHAGRWAIGGEAVRLRPAGRWADLLLPGTEGYIDWFAGNGAGLVLPLRPLAPPSQGRVKAYRKQVREGILPPVLLWWISGLDCYVVLDGHDRLAAALAEDVPPPVLALASVSSERAARETDRVLDRYARTADALERHADAPGAAHATAAVGRRLAETLTSVEATAGVTQAWPLPGGTAGWNALAAAHLPNLC